MGELKLATIIAVIVVRLADYPVDHGRPEDIG
jgi:hypothetical protein